MNPLQLAKVALGRWHEMNPTVRENLLVFGSLTLVMAVVLVWAAFFRKPHRHRPHRHRPPPPRPESAGNLRDPESSDGAPSQRHRRRRRRREHRPRNPTLAETGGLPPLRAERPPESFP